MKTTKRCQALVWISFLGLATAAAVAEPVSGISFKPSVPFAEGVIPDAIKNECDLPKTLADDVIKAAQKLDVPLRVSEDEADFQETNKVLVMEIAEATPGAFGVAGIGKVPATLKVTFQLVQNGEVLLRNTKDCHTKTGGFMGMNVTACSRLEHCADSTALFVVRTLAKRVDLLP